MDGQIPFSENHPRPAADAAGRRYLYRLESVSRLVGARDGLLRLERRFGPPRDFSCPMLDGLRKQLPPTRAIYTIEVSETPPPLPPIGGQDKPKLFLLRIARNSRVFLDLTGIADSRTAAAGRIYFGIDAAIGARRESPNLGLPLADIDIHLGGRWVRANRRLLGLLAAQIGTRSSQPLAQASAASRFAAAFNDNGSPSSKRLPRIASSKVGGGGSSCRST